MQRIILLALLFYTYIGSAQTQYDFSTFTSTYTPLTGANSLSNGQKWDDPEIFVPIDFPFQFFDSSVHYLYSSGIGAVSTFDTMHVPEYQILNVLSADIVDRGFFDTSVAAQSPISYTTDGITGDRILKIQYENTGFFADLLQDSISTDYLNFQIWLYEKDFAIEIHFGPSSVSNPAISYEGKSGLDIALFEKFNRFHFSSLAHGYALTGDPSSPTVVTPSTLFANHLNGTPQDGRVYRFSVKNVAVQHIPHSTLSKALAPNPAHDKLNILDLKIKSSIETIHIYDNLGKLIKYLDYAQNEIDISDLQPGQYIIQMLSAKQNYTQSILVK